MARSRCCKLPVPATLPPHFAHKYASSICHHDSNRYTSLLPQEERGWESLGAGEDFTVLVLLQSASTDRERGNLAAEDSGSESGEADESASWGIDSQCCGAVKERAGAISRVPGTGNYL